jgi:hypothetical protein
MKPMTVARLALAGSRTDTFRIVLTAGSSALASLSLLAAATVSAVPESPGGDDGYPHHYSTALIDQAGLRPGVVTALLLLAIPVLALAGQCIRFGSPARDRRLAALRLAGATPGQAVLIAAVETGGAGLLGAVLGFGALLIGRRALHRPDVQGLLPLPTDVLPPAPIIVAVLVLVPLLASLFGALLLRRVIITPLGVVRRTRTRPPRLWPGVLIVGGVFAPFVIRPIGRLLSRFTDGMSSDLIIPGGIGLVLLAVLGVVVGTGWIAHTTGRLLHRFGHRPAMMLAGRQLMADPWSGSRTFAALLAGVIVGAGALGYRISMVTGFAADVEANRRAGVPADDGAGLAEDPDFYLGAVDMVNLAVAVAVGIAAVGIMVALVEGIVSRRRAYAALVATGVPRRTLGEAVAWQTLAPLVPAILVALAVGVSMVRTTIGTSVTSGSSTSEWCTGTEAQCAEPNSTFRHVQEIGGVMLPIPVPLGDLAILGGATFAAMLIVVAVGLFFLRRSTDLEELRVG